MPLVRPTAHTRLLVGTAAATAVRHFRRASNYAKAGVMLLKLEPASEVQEDLIRSVQAWGRPNAGTGSACAHVSDGRTEQALRPRAARGSVVPRWPARAQKFASGQHARTAGHRGTPRGGMRCRWCGPGGLKIRLAAFGRLPQ